MADAPDTKAEQMNLEDAYKALMHYVEKYPVLFPIMHSTLFVQILRSLKNTKDIIMLQSVFPFIETHDLEEILAMLVGIGLVEKFKATNKDFYCLTDVGKKFLELYDNARMALLRGGLKEMKV